MDVQCFDVCPKHRLHLVAETESHTQIGTFWPHFDIGPDGAKLTDGALARAAQVDPALEVLIENRLAGRRTDVLRDYELFDIIDVSALVGRFLAGKDDGHQNGFKAILLPEQELLSLLRRHIVDTVPTSDRQRGLRASLGPVLQTGTIKSRAPLASWFEKQMLRAFAEVAASVESGFGGSRL